jgi:hypothetical protein
LASFAPLRLAPWNNAVNEKITLLWKGYSTGRAPWNTDSTEVKLFARSTIPQGESSFIRFHKASHRLSDSINPNSTENFKYVWLGLISLPLGLMLAYQSGPTLSIEPKTHPRNVH